MITCARAQARTGTNYPFLTLKERDVETGLDYFNARYYSSVQGRFTSVDIAGPNLSNPQSFNKYAYTLNNPLRYIDPKGLYEEDVHFQLTYALGMAAGFTAGDAQNIAHGDQSVDDDLRGPFNGVEARRNYHFTTQARRDQLWDSFVNAAGAYTGPNNSNENALDSLGTFLHAQQDSYSHEGFGPKLGQGWPPWTGTGPDKTYNDPAKADRMAEDTYNRLTTAATVLYNNQKISFHYKPLEWKVISPFVQAFNRARTPEEKQKALNQIRTLAQQNLERQAQERQAPQVRKVRGVRMHHLTRILTLVPIVAGAISTLLFLAQGGFGGGHSPLDFVIEILGLPSILLNLVLPASISLPDILLIVWIPALMNAILFFLFGRVLSSLRKSEG